MHRDKYGFAVFCKEKDSKDKTQINKMAIIGKIKNREELGIFGR